MRLVSYLAPGHPAALFEALGEKIGAGVGFVVGRSGPDPAADPFRAGTADLGWVCSTSFVELTTGRPPSVELVGVSWVPDDPDAQGRPVYFSDVLVRPGSGIETMEDLAGRRIGCNDAASLSGYHALRIDLDRRGHDPDSFADLVMTGGHLHSLDRLLAGEVDAAVIDSIVKTRRARQWPEVAALRLIERLGPWPAQPVVIASGRGADEVAAIRAGLLAANDDPELRGLFAECALDRLVATDPDHCEVVRDAMQALSETPCAVRTVGC